MWFKPTFITAMDIPDAWFQCVNEIQDLGFRYEIQQGSNVGQTRLEFDYVTVLIAQPYIEPYDLMLPQIPLHLNIPNPVAPGYIEQYLPYLMTADIKDNEEYTYGSRLNEVFIHGSLCGNQVQGFIDLLKKTPNTNQAILRVCQPSDIFLPDPPCLCIIDMRIKDGHLIFYPYFRSWDLWAGFPANLAAITVLQKYMADEIGVNLGPICASSKGLHLYDYAERLAKLRTNR